METLKIKDLQEGVIYQCLLSGNKVLIIDNTNGHLISNHPLIGYYFNKSSGLYEIVSLMDDLLTTLK